MASSQKIYVAMGFHVNYNHSYRGDTHDDAGFGYDTDVIRGIVKILDRANRRGLQASGTWEFDIFWSVQNCMKRYAPELLEAIARRVKAGLDEVIVDNWNNGSMAWASSDELELMMQRAITNEWGSGVRDIFGEYSPVIRSQETMFSHGNIPVFKAAGMKAICMYYSAIPFDALRNFVPVLSPEERFNPLNVRCPVSGEDFLIIPMYSQGDIFDNLSLEMWLRKIRKHQLSGKIPGNALLYINMDADAPIWTGMGLPKFLNFVPNLRGLDEFIEVINKLDYAEFCKLGDYIENNPVVGEINIDLDTADGSHTGFNSWTEKWINYALWTVHQRGRRMGRAAEALLQKGGAPGEALEKARELLTGPGLSNRECRVLATSTTHFGLASPLMCPDRLRVAFHFADSGARAASEALNTLLETEQPPALQDHELDRITLLHFNKYDDAPAPRGAETMVAAAIKTPSEDPMTLRLVDDKGNSAPFDFLNLEKDKEKSDIIFMARPGDDPIQHYTLLKSEEPEPKGLVKSEPGMISNGLITVRLDDAGFVTSLRFQGGEYAADPFMSPGVTYRANDRDVWCGPREFEIRTLDPDKCGPRQRLGMISLYNTFPLKGAGREKNVFVVINLMLLQDLPYLFVNGYMELPETESRDTDRGISTRIAERFDNRWREVMPLNIVPGFSNKPGSFLKIWKHNYMNVTHGYDLDFGAIDPQNKNVDAFNNHVTDGWVAAGNGERGLLLAHDQSVNTSAAMCPMRLRENGGRQTLYMNPFGTYHGDQFSHMPDGSGAARELAMATVPHLESAAPAYNGREIEFMLMMAPFEGDAPPAQVQKDAAAFSMPPVALHTKDGRYAAAPDNPLAYEQIAFHHVEEYNLEETRGWEYEDFLKNAESKTSSKQGPGGKEKLPSLPVPVMMKLLRDSIRATLKIEP